jgi:hypothetical protein
MVTELFAALNGLTNNMQVSIVSQYNDFCNSTEISLAPNDSEYESVAIDAPFTFQSYWGVFLHGYGYRWGRRDDPGLYNVTNYPRGLNVPGVIDARKNAINSMLTTWGANPPTDFITIQTAASSQANKVPATAAKRVLDTWAGANSMPAKVITAFETKQRLKMTDLLKSITPLTADNYFFILHLLIGLCTSIAADKALALTVVSEKADSQEYENDTFINQLLYLSLMYMGDPKGSFKFNSAMLQSILKDTLAIIKSTDDASKAIKDSIEGSIALLNSDASYPMQDLYNPSIGFNTRKADTLAALEEARIKIKAKLT